MSEKSSGKGRKAKGKAPVVPPDDPDDMEFDEEQASPTRKVRKIGEAGTSHDYTDTNSTSISQIQDENERDSGICTTWECCNRLLPSWDKFNKSLYGPTMMVCAICGMLVLSALFSVQTDSRTYTTSMRTVHIPCTYPPYLVEAPYMAPYITYKPVGLPGIGGIEAKVCDKCYKQDQRNIRASHIVQFEPKYTTELLSVHPAMTVQQLSLVNLELQMRDIFNGFPNVHYKHVPFMEGPLVGLTVVTENDIEGLKYLHYVNMQANPLFSEYLPHIERPPLTNSTGTRTNRSSSRNSIPVLSRTAIANIVEEAKARDTRQGYPYRPLQNDTVQDYIVDVLSTADPTGGTSTGTSSLSDRRGSLILGSIVRRGGLLIARPAETNVFVDPCETNSLLDDDGRRMPDHVTPESCIMPYMFPHGRGMYNGSMHLADYAIMRGRSGFSPFTMHLPYIVLLYMFLRCTAIVSSVHEEIIQTEVASYRRSNPNASELDVLEYCIRYAVPNYIQGSPAWHRTELENLMLAQHIKGKPDLFFTATEDEVSSTRWPAFDNIQAIMSTFHPDPVWNRAPTESVRAFHARFTTFWKRYIIPEGDQEGILGHVIHWMVRFETQSRGSLHAHCMIWLDPKDVDKVSEKITAHVPGTPNPDGTITPPTNPTALRLHNLVVSKQLHKCKSSTCRTRGLCCFGFPYTKYQISHKPLLDPKTGRYTYYRPNYASRNVVPYVPDVALLWGAHTNVQKCTNSSWTYYLLKYTLKEEPTGQLELSETDLDQFGIKATPTQARIASAMYLTKPVNAIEASMYLLKIPVIWQSASLTVRRINSTLPRSRMRSFRGGNLRRGLNPHSVDKYCARPDTLAEITFYDYFQNYDMHNHPLRASSERYIGVDYFGKYIYKRTSPIMTRFTSYHPTKNLEGFYYNLLLQNVPFRSELEITPLPDQSYQDLAMTWDGGNHPWQLVSLSDHCVEYAQRHLYSEIATQQLMLACDALKEQYATNPSHPIIDEAEGMPISCKEFLHQTSKFLVPFDNDEQRNNSNSMGDEPSNDPPLSSKQQKIADEILNNNDQKWFFLTGGPGTGKSCTIRQLTRMLTNNNKKVALCASTGAAALRLGYNATTCHHLFSLNPKCTYLTPLTPSSDTYRILLDTDYIFIDECSMLTSTNLNHIYHRIESVYRNSTVPHGKARPTVVLIGDLAQLPCVCKIKAHRAYDLHNVCTLCHITRAQVWPNVKKLELTEQFRCKSSWYVQFLNHIRHNQPTHQQLLPRCTVGTRTERPAMLRYLLPL